MELRDLYDSKRMLTGKTIEKGQSVPPGYYYITVVVFIENDKGEFLLQKRVPEKDGKWATTGGHPKSGENSLEGIVTEIKEELGQEVHQDELILYKTVKTDDDFIDMYYLKKNIEIKDLILQTEEVEEAMWASREKIQELIDSNKFSSSHKEFYEYCLEFLDEQLVAKKIIKVN